MGTRQHFYYDRQKSRGQAVIEFILLMVVVATMIFAIFQLFGEPLRQGLLDQRQKLVAFIGGSELPGDLNIPNETPVVALPDGWYRAEPLIGNPTGFGGGGAGGGGGGGAPGTQTQPPAPPPPVVPPGAAPINVAQTPQAGLPPATPPGSAATTPADADAGRGGGGGGPDGSSDSQGGGSKLGAGGQGAAKGTTASGSGTGGDGGRQGETEAEEYTRITGEKVREEVYFDETSQTWKKRLVGEDGQEVTDEKRRERLLGKRAKGDKGFDDRTRNVASDEFDWLTILKIAILVLLLVFIFYIAIGSVRRRRNN